MSGFAHRLPPSPRSSTPCSLAWLVLGVWLGVTAAEAGDWPMWRYDAPRGAASPDELPPDLKLSWIRHYAQRQQAWDDPLNNDLMTYDRVFEPIVVGRKLILGFNDRDKVVALDIDSGAEAWTFYCDGPVRMPPAAWDGKVYVTSDDGHLYCLDAEQGTVVWKFRGAPSARKALGNTRLVSCWPARGGAVVRDGKVYFSASIWPFMGTFVYALDARTGRVVWVNDGTGANYVVQPHGAPSFAGVAPQGALVATSNMLLVPGGRSTPAGFDRATGVLRHFNMVQKGVGGSFVCADEQRYFVHTRYRGVALCDLASGQPHRIGKRHFVSLPSEPVLLEKGTIYFDGKRLVAAAGKFQFKAEVDASGDVIVAGSRVYAAGKKQITALDAAGKTVWSQPVAGEILRLLAGGDKLVAVALDGRILVFGDKAGNDKPLAETVAPLAPAAEAMTKGKELLAATGAEEGYALWYGVDDPAVLEAVLAQSKLHVVAVDADAAKVESLRRRLDAAGLYGKRVAVHVGDPLSFGAPPYIAHLVVCGEAVSARCREPGVLAAVYESVRPYGGALALAAPQRGTDLAAALELAKLSQARPGKPGTYTFFRDGPLPGAANWTHQYGDIANTVKSNDKRVKLPLGILWWGGSSNLDVLPRHGHGPPQQVIGGRTIIEGMDCLSARDNYTGRVLWKRTLPELGNFGVYFNETYKDMPLSTSYNQVHIPGANGRGTNFVATADEIYVVLGSRCEVLDAATGKTLRTIGMPKADGEAREPLWGFIGLYGDILLGGAGFANYTGEKRDLSVRSGLSLIDMSASDGLVALDRNSGKLLWRVKANCSFLHNGIVAGGGRVYLLDRLPGSVEANLKRRGLADASKYRIVALDARTGKEAWSQQQNIFGTWLSYSEKHDLLLQAGARNSDRMPDEVDRGMLAYRGKDGSVAWQDLERQYAGPCILHNDRILTNVSAYRTSSGAFSLVDGKPNLVTNPLTGEDEPWKITRNYGCNSIIASEHLLTFRSGAAGFYDLAEQGGTGNFGGFKSSCTSNLIAADGVLNAPDYTRTCSCSYQNQTSLALIHMPDVEVWTTNLYQVQGWVRRLGVNLAAPGDRRSAEGTMWLEWPSVGGASPGIHVDVKGASVGYYRRNAATVSGEVLPWVAASGAFGAESVAVKLNYGGADSGKAPKYTVRLYFAEPDPLRAGERVFDVALDGRTVLKDFDVCAAAGGPNRSVMREFANVAVTDTLTITLVPKAGTSFSTLFCGVEFIAED